MTQPGNEPGVAEGGPVGRAPGPGRSRARPGLRFALLLALVGGFGLAVLILPRPDTTDLSRAVNQLGPAAPVVAVLGGALLLVALVPRTFLTLASGALFGPLPGAGYALAAAVLAALLGFGAGRLLGRDFVARRVRGRLAQLDGWFSRQSVLGVITVRLLPIGGFGLVSYGYGATGARLGPFLLGSLLASTPSAFGYAAIGAAAVSPGRVNWLAVAPAALGLVASAVLLRRGWRAVRPDRAGRRGPARPAPLNAPR